MRIITKALFVLSLFGLFTSSVGWAKKSQARFHKVIYIVLENTSVSQALKNPVLKNFADQGVFFSKFMAETHPSQGNYIAMVAGDLLGVSGDGIYNLSQTHLGDLLESHNMTWRNYAEDYPGKCFTGATAGKYVRKHVPFISFTNVTKNANRCANIVDMMSFQNDWHNNRLANFNFVSPNLDDDGHDTDVNAAAEWVQRVIVPMMKDPKNMEDTVVILTFDEATYFGKNQIYTALFSPTLPMKKVISTQVNHVSLLKWLEDEWGLGNLGRGDAKATPIGL